MKEGACTGDFTHEETDKIRTALCRDFSSLLFATENAEATYAEKKRMCEELCALLCRMAEGVEALSGYLGFLAEWDPSFTEEEPAKAHPRKSRASKNTERSAPARCVRGGEGDFFESGEHAGEDGVKPLAALDYLASEGEEESRALEKDLRGAEGGQHAKI